MNIVSDTNVLEIESTTTGKNSNQFDKFTVEENINLKSPNNDLIFQLTSMQEGLIMKNILDNNDNDNDNVNGNGNSNANGNGNVNGSSNENDNDNNVLINSLIDNALSTNEETDNIDKVTDYSSYSLGDFEKLTLKELQDVARQNKLKIKGKKTELIDRVKAHYNFSKNLV